jgi:two-component system, OmpR family, phosphate regulon sensor histidine kinase PhoR
MTGKQNPPRAMSLWAYRYRRIVLLLVGLFIVPSILLSSVGVMLLVLGEQRYNLMLGILVLSFTSAMITGVVLIWVFVRRDTQLSMLQADFVSKVSHELRTPLTSIRLFTETLALRRGSPEAEQRCIEALMRESRRLQDLIDRLLDWGRMESGRKLYTMEDASVEELVNEAIKSSEPILSRHAATVSVEVPVPLSPVCCDKGAVMDAVINLLSNASKYGGEPPVVRLRAIEEDGEVRISVSDNGHGIEPREHKRIFQKFYRIDDRLAREREGSGLGLAIVDHVMRAHGGYVEIDSALGKGSTFTLVLPRGK